MLLDVALVTKTLMNLIQKCVEASPEAGKVTPLSVTPLPPDKLNGKHTIGLYLYHMTEDANYKNLEPPSTDDADPIRFTPMGLNLHYLLTGYSDLDGDTGPETEQTMVGLAMKALHDLPFVDDSTQIQNAAGTLERVFPSELQETDNKFRIVLEPVKHSEATTYWTAGTHPLRLALYYQVSVVLLEPETQVSRFGRVLSYGAFTFPGSAPHLSGSRSTLSFTVPGQASRSAVVQPAAAALGEQIVFSGSGFGGGKTTLLIKGRQLPDPTEVGADWALAVAESEIVATIGTFLGAAQVVPGMYSALAKVIETRILSDGSRRDIAKTSNETPFAITPYIRAIQPPDANQQVLIQGGVFKSSAIPSNAVEVFLGSQRLTEKTGSALDHGQFEIIDTSNLRFRYPKDVTSRVTLAFRLIINGAESAPNWVIAP